MGERRKSLGEQWGHGLAHGNMTEGGRKRGPGEAEGGDGARGEMGASALRAARPCKDLQKVLECPVLASSVQGEPWWPGRTLPSLRGLGSEDGFRGHRRMTASPGRFPAEFRCGDCGGDTEPEPKHRDVLTAHAVPV